MGMRVRDGQGQGPGVSTLQLRECAASRRCGFARRFTAGGLAQECGKKPRKASALCWAGKKKPPRWAALVVLVRLGEVVGGGRCLAPLHRRGTVVRHRGECWAGVLAHPALNPVSVNQRRVSNPIPAARKKPARSGPMIVEGYSSIPRCCMKSIGCFALFERLH